MDEWVNRQMDKRGMDGCYEMLHERGSFEGWQAFHTERKGERKSEKVSLLKLSGTFSKIRCHQDRASIAIPLANPAP